VVGYRGDLSNVASTALACWQYWPSAVLILWSSDTIFAHRTAKRTLMYAVSGNFFGLLYLALFVRSAHGWPGIPPEASAAVLLFLLVIFIEPMQTRIGKAAARNGSARDRIGCSG